MADITPQSPIITNPTDGNSTVEPAVAPAPQPTAPAITPAAPALAVTTPWAAVGSARPPHTKTESTLAPTSEFVRIFLLAWIVRYIPRGVFSELVDIRTFDPVKNAVTKFIRKGFMPGWEKKINKVFAENHGLVEEARAMLARGEALTKGESGMAGYEGHDIVKKLRPHVREWRAGDNSPTEISKLVSGATLKDGKYVMSDESRHHWTNLMRGKLDDIGYPIVIGLGSAYLSLTYGKLVRHDIQNIFREAVAYEKDVPQEQVTFKDIEKSDNAVVQVTMKNYTSKLFQRLATDAMFVIPAMLKSLPITEIFLGGKGVQILSETWKRKTTMFEDLVSFINTKINPRNGLGQPIARGEVFDLYQHYMEITHPDKAFSNVISQGGEEGLRWAKAQPIFERMTELMNNSYAYKHATVIDPHTGNAVKQADFALPKFIYMLGHDLIDPALPEQTMALIEIANARGIPAVKEAQKMLASGINLNEVMGHYQITLDALTKPATNMSEKNGVLPKGSTMQLDAAPATAKDHPITKISVETIRDHSLPDKMLAMQAAT